MFPMFDGLILVEEGMRVIKKVFYFQSVARVKKSAPYTIFNNEIES
jgi:hypothetical protein